jgi:Tfp pilus assembly protein PilF
VAVTLNNLAALLHARGQSQDALPLYRRALETKEAVLGPDHPDVAMTLHNLAVLQGAGGAFAEADQLYRRALSICDGALGPDHPRTAVCRERRSELRRAELRRQAAEKVDSI